MSYKMIVIDIDDTLIDDERNITEPTKAALAQAVEQGVIVTIATGRMYPSAKMVASQLQLNVPLISYQGSYVRTLVSDEVLYERSVPVDAARALFEYAKAENLHIQAYTDHQLYAKEENEKVKAYSQLSKVPYVIEPDFDRLLEKPLTKVLYFEEPERIAEIVEALTPQLGDKVHMTTSKPYFLEFIHKEGTKGHAVQFLAEHFGCSLSEVIAIGDGWNDKEMIEIAGLGVAMGNAADGLKEIADYVTLTNNEDGVKHVVDKFILESIS